MKAVLISIGDELLIGQTINTNASWLGQELKLRGIQVEKVLTISDEQKSIEESIVDCFKSVDLIIMTGGLGPTKDDITKVTIAELYNRRLVMHEETLQRVTDFFAQRNRPMLEVNKMQALIPEDCKILVNNNGTAPGMWIEDNGKVLISLPGVPYEMKAIMEDNGFDELLKFFKVTPLYHKTILLQGIGESFLADQIQVWEDDIRAKGLGLAYLPSPGIVKLRISTKDKKDASLIDSYFSYIEKHFPKNVFGYEKDRLPDVVGGILREQKKSLATAESCTGGALSKEIVSSSGASDYFYGSLNTYSNALKNQLLEVPMDIIHTVGAVSEEVVKIMADKCRKKLGVDYCISVSGIAGPLGGSTDKPVGTVWIGISGEKRTFAKKFLFGNDRERNIELTVKSALNMLRCELLGLLEEKK